MVENLRSWTLSLEFLRLLGARNGRGIALVVDWPFLAAFQDTCRNEEHPRGPSNASLGIFEKS